LSRLRDQSGKIRFADNIIAEEEGRCGMSCSQGLPDLTDAFDQGQIPDSAFAGLLLKEEQVFYEGILVTGNLTDHGQK
jgi:hypothetical protein